MVFVSSGMRHHSRRWPADCRFVWMTLPDHPCPAGRKGKPVRLPHAGKKIRLLPAQKRILSYFNQNGLQPLPDWHSLLSIR
jgi:hypothetical protein